jgi:hypothetical protein
VLRDRVPPGRLRPVAGTNPFLRAADQQVALQHHPPGIEQGPILFTQAAADPRNQRADVFGGAFQGRTKQGDLRSDVADGLVRYRVEISGGVDDVGGAEGDAGRRRDAGEEAIRKARSAS